MLKVIQGIIDKDWGKDTWKKLAGIIAVYFAIMFLLFNISGVVLGKFLILNIVSIFLPGVALLSWLNIQQSKVGAFCTSYILGYSVIILEYFVVMLSAQSISFFMITVLIAIISLLVICWKHKKYGKILHISKTGLEGVEILLLAFMVILNVSVYSATNLGPDVVPVVTLSRDLQYWVNNTVALKLAWPPSNLFMSGSSLTYHYFSGIPIAFFSVTYGIDVFSLSFPLYSFTKAVVMVGAVQFLCKTLELNKKLNIIAYLLLLFSTGYEKYSIVTIYHHLLYAPFGFDMGYAYAIMFVAFILKQWCKEGFDYRLWLGMLLVWSMEVGAKTPVAAVMMVFAGYVCFYWLYKKKFAWAFGYGLPILFMFWLIGKYCVGMFATIQGETAWSLSLYGLDDHSYMHSNKVIMLTSVLGTFGKIIIFVVMATLRTIVMNFPVVIGSVMAIIIMYQLVRKKLLPSEEINLRLALFITALVGLGLWHLVDAGGASEMYFAIAALIPLNILLLKGAKDYESLKQADTIADFIVREKMWRRIFTVCLVVGVGFFFCCAYGKMGVIRQGMWAIRNFYQVATDYEYSQSKDSISREDVKALVWLRDNAESGAIIMSDRAVIGENYRYYLYGIFSECQQYMEGTDMLGHKRAQINGIITHRKHVMTDVYNNSLGAVSKAKSEGVNYIVQTIDVTPKFKSSHDELELVSASSTINIYKIK